MVNDDRYTVINAGDKTVDNAADLVIVGYSKHVEFVRIASHSHPLGQRHAVHTHADHEQVDAGFPRQYRFLHGLGLIQ